MNHPPRYSLQSSSKMQIHTAHNAQRAFIRNVGVCWLVLVGFGFPATGQTTLYNGIILPANWPPAQGPTQQYQIPSYITSPPAVIPINLGRQLFVDDFLISQTTLTRTVHRPIMYSGNPILSPGGWDNSGLALPYSDGVWYDPSAQIYKMWYDGGYGDMVSYATSTDGKNWTKPSFSDSPVPGSNMVLQVGSGRDSAVTWLDLLDPNPNRRYKEFAYYPVNASNPQMLTWFSADGIHWNPQSNFISSISDRTTLFYNPFRAVWVDSMRSSVTFPAASTRDSYYGRARYYAESSDLSTWTPSNPTASFWTGPDVNDPPYTAGGAAPELYNLDGVAYESLMVGLFSWFYSDQTLVELGVGFSRDGFQWTRPTRGSGSNAFIAASNQAGTWNGYNTQSAGGGFLVVGDQLWFYFSGRNYPHGGSGNSYTGLAMLRRDGFYSMDAGSTEGTLLTRPVEFSGNHFFVNTADSQGTLYVEVVDPSTGNTIAPFSKANCNVVTIDSTRQEVTWNGASDLSSLAGRTVQFRFYLTNGSLYSFWVTDASGASHGYVAAGGPGLTGATDTVGNGAGSPNVAPTVTVTAPPQAQQLSGNSVIVTATATDTFSIASIQLLLDGNNLGSPCPGSPCSINWDTSTASNGYHGLGAFARDSAGNSANSSAVTVQVSNASSMGSSYAYSRPITIPHSNVPNSDQSNFPVLISGAYTFLATQANGGHVQTANGYDIIFTSDAAGQNLLKWELESYNPATGAIQAWVQVPTLSHAADTTIYMLYGNSGISVFQGGPAGSAWDSNFAGVWHLPNGTTLSANDSTANGNNGVVSGANAAAGEIGGGASFNGASSSIDAGHGTSLNAAGKVTLEAWINSSVAAQNGVIVGKWNIGDSSNNSYTLYTGQDSTNNKFAFAISQANGIVKTLYPSTGTYSVSNWAHVAGVADGNSLRIYLNGVDTGSTVPYDGTTEVSTKDLVLGKLRSDDNTYNFAGTLDEVRVSTTARSADWIKTEYNNQSSPSTFYVVGTEQSTSTPPVLTVCTGTNNCPGSLSFNATAGGMNPASQNLSVSNSGGGTLSWTANSNQSWLTVSPASGTGAQTLTVSVSTAGLNAGPYSGAITVSASGANGSPQAVNVSLNVAPAPQNSYSYFRSITIPASQVPNTDQSNFPVLISGSYPFFATVANGGHVQNANGYDIVFTSDTAGQHVLNWELETYNAATGTINAWVQVPTLSHSAATTIYLFYGNSGITTFQGGAAGAAWDSNFAGVWHLPNGSTLSAQDSTVNGNNGTINGALAVSGEIGGAANFTGASTSINAGQAASLNASGKVTLEAWIKPSVSAENGVIVGKWNIGNSNNNSYTLYTGQDASNSKFAFAISQANGTVKGLYPASGTYSANSWSHVAGVADGNNLRLYVNGVDTGSTLPYDGTIGTSTKDLVMGKLRSDDNIYDFAGVLDEVRVSTSARSADWIATEYNNQSSPATFYSMGNELGTSPVLTVCTVANNCPGTLSFSGIAGGSNPAGQTISISNSGGGTLSWTANSNQSWLMISSISGTGAQTLNVTVSTAGLNPGAYNGAITVTADGVTGSPQVVNVSLTVSPESQGGNGYSYWRALTIAHAQVPNTDQTNFPVLVSGTYSSLATTTNGGHVNSANGYDIIFTSDAAGQNLLHWELESYNPVTGAINAWVQVPTLSHTADTIIYIFYGNSTITTFQGGAAGAAWDNSFAAVWHLPNGTTLSALDSTANANNGTVSGATAVSGKLDGAAGFNGASSSIDAGHAASLNASGKVTLEAWINPSASPQNGAVVGKWNIGNSNNNSYILYTGQDSTTNKFAFSVSQANGTIKGLYPATGTYSANTWVHVAGVADGSNLRIYVNGVDTGSTAAYDGTIASSTKDLTIGKLRSDDNIYEFAGAIDEVRVSTTARSADWITTEYNNQSAPSGFYSLGAEQSGPPPPVLNVCTGTNSCPGTLTFTGTAGGTSPASQNLSISNSGSGALNWTASSNEPWLSVSSANGSGPQTLSVSVSPSGLSGGPYNGAITVTANGALGTPQMVNVTFIVSAAGTTDHYVSPAGSPSGDGTVNNPWDLQTALNEPATVKAGDTIWLRAGTYSGIFNSSLSGSTGSPIIVRQYPGERATIAGQLLLGQNGDHDAWFWGFEIYNRSTALGNSGQLADCVDMSSSSNNNPGLKLINLVLHDCVGSGVGYWAGAINGAVYGSLIYNNGYDGCTTECRGHGHGLYVQSDNSHLIEDNIIFRNFSEGTQLYGSSAAPRDNVTYLGNVFFNSGELSQLNGGGFNSYNIYVDGGQVSQNTQLVNNYTYSSAPAGHNQYYEFDDSNNSVISGNYFLTPGPGVQGITVGSNNPGLSMTGNTFYGATNFNTSAYPQNTYLTSQPTVPWTFVRSNQYEAGRANVVVYNWNLQSSVSIDLSGSGLHVGQTYRIMDSQNFFGTAVLTGTYTGQPVTIPMNNLVLAAPIGIVPLQPKHTAPTFDVFVVIPTSS